MSSALAPEPIQDKSNKTNKTVNTIPDEQKKVCEKFPKPVATYRDVKVVASVASYCNWGYFEIHS